MAITSSNSRVSPGAGRSLHLMWPNEDTIGGALGNNGVQRLNAISSNAIATAVSVGAPPAVTTPTYRGLQCWKCGSAAAGAGVGVFFAFLHNAARNQNGAAINLDDRGVIETRWLLAFDRPAGDLSDSLDLGVTMFPGSANLNVFNPATGSVYRAGTQFGPGGPGKLRFRTRGGQTIVGPPPYNTGLGPDSGNVAVAGFDERDWHWYAIRVVGASSGGNGTCKALLDGVPFGNPFSIDTVSAFYPDPTSWPAAIGVRFGVGQFSNNTFDSMYIARGSLIIAPTEADL